MRNTIEAKKANLSDLLRISKGGAGEQHESNIPEVIDWTRVKLENPTWSPSQIRERLEDLEKYSSHDCLLYANQYGRLVVSNRKTFPITFNSSANTPTARGSFSVVRPYWLGTGSTVPFATFNYKHASVEDVESFISETLVNQVVEMVLMYAFDPETTPFSLKLSEQRTGKSVQKKWYRKTFDFYFEYSTYAHKLVTNLAEWFNQGCPDEWDFPVIPEQIEYHQWVGPVLLKEEYEAIKAKLKNRDFEMPRQVQEMKRSDAQKLIHKTNEELTKEIAFLRSQLENQKPTNSTKFEENLEELREQYKELYGVYPAHNARAEKIKERIKEKK